ncbi:MAG: ABC transporter ATP-binding protein [Caldisericales bacterium]|nr:ABC transporter ATP-binding protein [Caldisericales bacterium]
MLHIKDLSFSYEIGKQKYTVFKNINLTVFDEEFFCIIGPSGCGKSTLLKVLAGFETPSSGKIFENEKLIDSVSYERAMVFQEDAVFPWLSVKENIEYGLKVRKVPLEIRKKIVDEYLELVGLKGFENAYPRQLSGGMRKRVDLGRVLANDPKILLMDEPFGALDAMTKENLQMKLIEIWEISKKMVIFITHDVEEALFLGDRIAVMHHIKSGGDFKIFDVPFQRPRELYLKEEIDFQHMRRDLIEEFRKAEERNCNFSQEVLPL